MSKTKTLENLLSDNNLFLESEVDFSPEEMVNAVQFLVGRINQLDQRNQELNSEIESIKENLGSSGGSEHRRVFNRGGHIDIVEANGESIIVKRISKRRDSFLFFISPNNDRVRIQNLRTGRNIWDKKELLGSHGIDIEEYKSE